MRSGRGALRVVGGLVGEGRRGAWGSRMGMWSVTVVRAFERAGAVLWMGLE